MSRTHKEITILDKARALSVVEPQVVSLDDSLKKERFTYQDGQLVDYKVARYGGKRIHLTEEEFISSVEFFDAVDPGVANAN